MAQRPPSGCMVWWRPKNNVQWFFGYVTYVSGHEMIRLGRWNGDTVGGVVADVADIDWKPYRGS